MVSSQPGCIGLSKVRALRLGVMEMQALGHFEHGGHGGHGGYDGHCGHSGHGGHSQCHEDRDSAKGGERVLPNITLLIRHQLGCEDGVHHAHGPHQHQQGLFQQAKHQLFIWFRAEMSCKIKDIIMMTLTAHLKSLGFSFSLLCTVISLRKECNKQNDFR
jgi:hypothetical protein